MNKLSNRYSLRQFHLWKCRSRLSADLSTFQLKTQTQAKIANLPCWGIQHLNCQKGSDHGRISNRSTVEIKGHNWQEMATSWWSSQVSRRRSQTCTSVHLPNDLHLWIRGRSESDLTIPDLKGKYCRFQQAGMKIGCSIQRQASNPMQTSKTHTRAPSSLLTTRTFRMLSSLL